MITGQRRGVNDYGAAGAGGGVNNDYGAAGGVNNYKLQKFSEYLNNEQYNL